MRRQIRKQMRVFVAIIFLLVGALAVASYLLSQERFYLPAWVPLIGTNFYEVKVELPTAQAVVPGQGQSVNIAGVKIGEVGDVQLENGRAVVTMQIQDKYKPIYHDANVLMRPKTGLKDMYLALDPGTKQTGALPEGGRVRVSNTLPDVNGDEILAQLDTDTRAYLEILLSAGGTAFDDHATGADARFQQTAEQDLREVLKRFEPTAKYGSQIGGQLISRRHNIKRVIHNFQLLSTSLAKRDDQLAGFVDSANKNFEAFASEESSLRAALREFPGALSQTTTTLAKTDKLAGQLGPALSRLRPFARNLAPALRQTRPFLRDTTPIIKTQIRPFARDVQPTVRDLRTAADQARTGHAAADAQLRRAQQVLQHARLRPARRHATVPVLERLERPQRRDAVGAAGRSRTGPARRGAGRLRHLQRARVGRGRQPAAGHRSAAPEPAARSAGLPQQPATQPAPMIKQAPSLGRILTMVAFALSCFGILVFLWLSFGGSVPLKPKGYRVNVAFPEATQLAKEAEVRISGVKVGRVKTTDPNKQTGLTDTVLEIDARYAPLPKDTRAILRQKTLLGETYVELSPGGAGPGQAATSRRWCPTAVICRRARSRRRCSSTRSCAPSTRSRASASAPGSTSRGWRCAGRPRRSATRWRC